MKCQSCGVENNDDALFCGSCGRKLISDAVTSSDDALKKEPTKRKNKKQQGIGKRLNCGTAL